MVNLNVDRITSNYFDYFTNYFLDKHQKSSKDFCGLKILIGIFKSLGRKATLHTRAFSPQDSRSFEKAHFSFQRFHIKNNFLTKFEKSRLFALHTQISSPMACSLFFKQ